MKRKLFNRVSSCREGLSTCCPGVQSDKGHLYLKTLRKEEGKIKLRRHLREYKSPPASPSMYVISLRITAVLRKPLSATLSPLFVSFSSRSPASGAFISLKAVAGTPLSEILRDMRQPFLPRRGRRLTELDTPFPFDCHEPLDCWRGDSAVPSYVQ